ncbi:tripartite tricarboxylate transporter TctB family protein [Ornithinimicrobium tianjinense]|uniref:DUF1468 domain-containing protein n=1 Tax=Ornithinimicrobium tianjinense TaxID=1195761 RepID=A0A917BI65_9MICO|nr:tripartite tricarboxylate transporter TctB family protein [Ornithinimicrobium tianjinense]GGF40314.1 hypothetical protein GCM10011366_04930 [Ornithinimicrobium tianjinense]
MSDSPARPEVAAPAAPAGHAEGRPWGRAVFFAVLLAVLVGYTVMAFQMDRITGGGRIGPGFFPQIIGSLGVLIAAGALVNSLRPGEAAVEDAGFEEDEAGEGDLGRHPLALIVTIALSGVLLLTLNSLGAIISSALFTIGLLSFLNRGRWVANILVAVLVPIAMYLLFQTALNAGLPSGLLPRF